MRLFTESAFSNVSEQSIGPIQSATGLYPELPKYNPQLYISFLQDPF